MGGDHTGNKRLFALRGFSGVKNGFSFFHEAKAQLTGAMNEVAQATAAAVEKAVRLRRLEQRASWSGWKIVKVNEDRFALVMKDCDHERHPFAGTISIDEVETFIRCCENRSRW